MIQGYVLGDVIYGLGLAVFFAVLLYYQFKGSINLRDAITSRDHAGTERLDPRKLMEIGAWYNMTLAMCYLVIHQQISEWFVAAYLGAATASRWLRDREVRMSAPRATPESKNAPIG